MNATILLALVKGLVDVDTKGKILSKVQQMDMDMTVAFVEAKCSQVGHYAKFC